MSEQCKHYEHMLRFGGWAVQELHVDFTNAVMVRGLSVLLYCCMKNNSVAIH